MNNSTFENWRKAIQDEEAPIILVLENDHYQPVIPISRQRVKVPRLRPTRNTSEEDKPKQPILKLLDVEEAYKLSNVSTLLSTFQEDHLTLDARKELLRALDSDNERGEEGIVFYHEHIPAALQRGVLQGEPMDSLAAEYAAIQNISVQGAQAILSDYQLSLTQEEEIGRQNTQESEYQPEEEWMDFPQDMRNDWGKHRKDDPNLPKLESKKDLKRFIGRFPHSFLYALRAQTTPYKFLQTLPTEMTTHWQDAIYAQAIYIQLKEIKTKKQSTVVEAWIAKVGTPEEERFSVYTKAFYQKLTQKSQWTKAKKLHYWGSEALAALDINSLPHAKVLAVAAELYGTRLPTAHQEKPRPVDYLELTIDLWDNKQEELLEEGLRDVLSTYVTLLQDRRAPLSPGY